MQGKRRMKKIELVVFTVLFTTVTWIGADVYLPAMPLMVGVFNTSQGLVNMTLLAYTLAMPVGSLVGGPISDKTGRRGPMLLGGLAVTAGSFACAISPNVGILIAVRVIAGLGGGVVCAIVMAILKDESDDDGALDKSVAVVQSFVVIGPVIAPFIGSLMLSFMGWRGIFIALGALNLICLLWYLPSAESLPREHRADCSIVRSLGLVFDVAKSAPFSVTLLALCMPAGCFGVFMTTCSYVYIDTFHLSNLLYSVYYGALSVISIFMPSILLMLRKKMSMTNIVRMAMVLLIVSGALTIVLGAVSPLVFFLTLVPFIFAEGLTRPASYMILMREGEDTAGSVSAMINFIFGLLVALGTPLASLGVWGGDNILAQGGSTLACGIIGVVLVIVLLRVLKSNVLHNADVE